MRASIDWGRHNLELQAPENVFLATGIVPQAAPLTDLAEATRAALETPFDFPPLRRALTPDDHVAVVLEAGMPHVGTLLPEVLRVIRDAGVSLEATTIVTPAGANQDWINDLPEDCEDVHVEAHVADDRKKLSYLASTREDHRIYLNRRVVDADQTVVLTRRAFDPLTGYLGGELALYPTLSELPHPTERTLHWKERTPKVGPSHAGQEAAEVAWLLGVPFFVQAVEGPGGSVLQIMGGPPESCREGERVLDRFWRREVAEAAEVVVASLTGDPGRLTFADLARALANAARVVRTGGKIVLLTEAAPSPGPASEILTQSDDPGRAVRRFQKEIPEDAEAGFLWATAATHAKLYVLSGMPEEAVEEMFATPLQHATQTQRILAGAGSVLLLPDAHLTLASVKA
ncbi:MAG: lactate racemase domain-containing protein [Gemmataceae bacterium]|nr:lactate racemase domain-containing protein [Gemmataceae bacterium]